MSGHSDDDLFTPTLTDADDAIDFDRPWNPWSLVVLTFFFGIVAGGGLLAHNFRRLGIPDRFYSTLAIVAVATVIIVAAQTAMSPGDPGSPADRDAARTVRFLGKAAACLTAMAIAAPQHRRFRLYQATGREPGRLLKPALAAILISLVVTVAVGAALQILVFRA
jgi:hypothetical protein